VSGFGAKDKAMESERYDLMPQAVRMQSDSLRSNLSILFKHKVKILGVFLAVLATAAVASFLRPSIYEAKSSILVKIGREYMVRPEAGSGGTPVMVSQEEMTNSEIQILTNRELIKQVIGAVGLEQMYPDLVKKPLPQGTALEAAADRFVTNLKVGAVRKSSVIQVAFRHTNPAVAAKAVNTLVDMYTEKHLQVFSGTKSSFVEKQLSSYADKLKDTENSLQRFKQKHGVFSLEDQRKLLLDQRTALDTAMKSAEDSIAELQKKMGTLKGQSKKIAESDTSYTTTERDKIIVEARSRMLTLQLEEQELLKKYTESNPLVVNIRKEIKMVNTFLAEQEREITRKVKPANPIYQNVQIDLIRAEADFHSQQAKAATLRQQLRQVDGELQSLDFQEKDMQQLKREQTINEKNYQAYADRAEEARIADDMNRLKLANVSVIEKASVPVKAVAPKRGLNLALGVVLGALMGIGLAFVSEFANQSFSNPDSVEKRLGLPVLAAIPYREG
jgi:polysaccharide chain length determinant protein (PEP-CTERM system associated)